MYSMVYIMYHNILSHLEKKRSEKLACRVSRFDQRKVTNELQFRYNYDCYFDDVEQKI